ncbi:NADP-dependent oxidoreductase [Herbaspirillum sp. YR522]|uniref:NADP-dependent oxidoreductase n=1 Tax=Herbaspirillum sp. YR522 TaxID=1144342 RepID=UPI00026FCD99|nr:NADP-dependent oxidoreductase [Herbaspirillum sp. YR522]EJM99811.1 Zn-dependent oxidoreductase, NADPH:quinone reductase [Herbaspirillum sp. YR522]
MKAAVITGFGGPEVVTIAEVPPGSALQPHQVALRIEAASANPLDLKILAGYMQQVFPVSFPYVPGTDFSGVVVATGAEVSHLQRGTRVFGRCAPTAGGAFAQHLCIDAQQLCVMPAEMSFEQAASLASTYGTARQALFDNGKLARGQRVLIHAGAGGVGSMAVQLAHLAGAYVIATASAANTALVMGLGADEVIDYRTSAMSQVRDIDLVLDTIGGATLQRSWPMVRAGGRIVTLVEFGIAPVNGVHAQSVFFADAAPALPEAVGQFQAGRLQIIIDSIFALPDTRAALEKLATGHARGKVVIRMR